MKVEVIATGIKVAPESKRSRIFMKLNVTASISWWNSFLSSGIGTFLNAEDAYDRVRLREFDYDDFEFDGLFNYGACGSSVDIYEARYAHGRVMRLILESLNGARDRYLECVSRIDNHESKNDQHWICEAKKAWTQVMILLPQSYLMTGDVVVYEDAFQRINDLAKSSPYWKIFYEAIMRNITQGGQNK